MRIHYKCKDDRANGGVSETLAATPSLALVYWYMRHLPENVYQTPGPYSDRFLMLVIAACERTWGTAPDFDLPEPPGKYDWKEAHDLYVSRDPAVSEYEDACLEILQWLKQYDIIEMTIE
jgi:hypothetical protein